MEFPAFRSREWLQAAFEGPPPPQREAEEAQNAQPSGVCTPGKLQRLVCPDFAFRGLNTTPRLLLATPSATTGTRARPTFGEEEAKTPSLYERRAQGVAKSIREALFRHALFQIQNVEVQTLKTCPEPRKFLAAEVLFDAGEDEGPRGFSFLQRLAWQGGAGELLRLERWTIERCQMKREFDVGVRRDASDFYSVHVRPRALSDRLRGFWFNFADVNED